MKHMKKLLFSLLAALALLPSVHAQTTHGRIVTDRLSNTAVLSMSGATPNVSQGNVFKTSNGAPTTVTNFLGGVDSQVISVTCGEVNTTFADNATIITASNLPIKCLSVGQEQDFVFDAATSAWLQRATPNVSQLPNTALSSTPTPSVDATYSHSYSMTLTANATLAVTGTPQNGNMLSLSLTEDGTGGWTFTFPGNFIFAPSFTFATAANAVNELTFKFEGTNWRLTSTGGGASGCTPGGGANSLQKNNGGACAASNETDDNTTFSAGIDAKFNGPNPYIDIRRYNVRAVVSTPTTTGSINSGSPTLTLASGTGFQNLDGIVVRGAGTTNSLSTPSAPTVTPSNPAFLTGTGLDVASATGATTYEYCYAAVTKDAQMTPCSTHTSIATGLASLGPQQVNVSSISASGTVITVTTAAAHTLGVGAQVVLKSTGGFDGWYRTVTVPDNTHFTLATQQTTTNGGPTSGTTGNVNYWNSNRIALTAVTNAYKYAIYGRTSGAMNFIGWAFPQTTLTTVGTYLNFDDYGSTMSSAPTLPDWVPSTAPAAAKNGDLVTTIVSGGGTTTLTLANNAGNTVAGATTKFDNAPNIVTAFAATQGLGKGTLVFPAAPGATYVTASVITIPFSSSAVSVQVGGLIALGDSLTYNSNIIWSGQPVNPQGAPSFSFQNYPQIVASAAWPMFYGFGNGNSVVSYLQLTNNSPNQGLIWLDDTGGQIPRAKFDNVQFVTQGTSDYMSMHYVARGVGGTGGFFFRQCQFFSGPLQVVGSTATPLVYFDGGSPSGVGGTLKFENTFSNRRGLAVGGNQALGVQVDDEWHYIQGGIMPLFSFLNSSGGSSAMGYRLKNYTLDTTAEPVVFVSSGLTGVVTIAGGVGPTVGTNIVMAGSGNITVKADLPAAFNLGQNAGTEGGPNTSSSIDGIKSNSIQGTNSQKQFNTDVLAGNQFHFAVIGLPMSAPTVTGPTAGGSLPIGTNTFDIAPVGVTNGEIAPRSPASNSCVTTSGQQTCTVNWVAYPGATGYNIYRNGFNGGSCTSPFVASGATVTAIMTTGGCGQSGPVEPGTGLSGVYNGGVFGPSLALTGAGFKTTVTTPVLTASRAVTFPDAAGAILLDSTLPQINSVYDNFNRANSILSSSAPPFGTWVAVTGLTAPSISSNQLVGTGAVVRQAAILTGSGLGTGDQFVQATAPVAENAANSALELLCRMSTSAFSGYLGQMGNNTVKLFRFTAGASVQLGSTQAITGAANDVLRLECQGSTIRVIYNGTQLISQSDSNFATGVVGVSVFGNVAQSVLDNWSGGNLRATVRQDSENDYTLPQHFPSMSVGASEPLAGALAANTAYLQNLILGSPGALSTSLNAASGNSGRVAQSSGALTNGDLGSFDANGNVVDSTLATTNVATNSSTTTFTNKTIDAEGTGNTITIPTKLFLRAALCNNGTAGFAADATSATPTVACFGTTTKIGVWQAADADAITWSYLLTSDFTGNIDGKIAFNSPDTTGTVIFNVALACVDGTGATADDPAYNSSSAFGTITLAAPANASWTTTVSNITKSGTTTCGAGTWMNIKVTRATDTGASRVNFKSLELTVRRAM